MFYPEIWNTFKQQEHCLGATRRDYPEWHKQRERYYVWAIAVDNQQVQQRLECYKNRLKPYLVDACLRQPHITLALSGFLSKDPKHNDDVTQAVIDHQAQCLRALAIKPFSLMVGRANSFLSAPFLEVKDNAMMLDTIRQALTLDTQDFRTTSYVPHITIGIYNACHLTALMAGMMGNNKEEAIVISVDSLGLYSYEASDIGSALKLEMEVLL